jgi:oligopeptidase B
MQPQPQRAPGEPPVAPVDPVHRDLHGVAWTDEYAWMRTHDDPRLSAYLRAERAFYDSATRHLADLTHSLFGEAERRIPPSDESVGWRRGDLFYYTRTVAGSEYEQFLSSRDQGETAAILLDEAEFAGDDGYVSVGLREVSPDARMLAYSVDTRGDEVYQLRFRPVHDRDLTRCDDLDEVVERTYYTGAWSADSTTFFYTVPDQLFRPHQVWRHRIGTSSEQDVLVFAEDDERYELTVRAATSHAYLIIESACRDTNESWLISAADPTSAPTLVQARRPGVEYHIDYGGDELFLVTNDDAVEYRLMRAPVGEPTRPHWTEMAPARPGERLHRCHALVGHLVLELRRDGFPLLRVLDLATGAEREIEASVPAGRLTLHPELEYTATSITIAEESLIEPVRWYAVDLRSGDRRALKQRPVPGYDPTRYVTRRCAAPAPDGTLVPVTIAHHADTLLDGTAPCLLWGYGAYESCDDPTFDVALASLLDRGVVFALSHPRGGGELGRRWWLDGRLSAKINTFTDHLAVADWLADGLVDPDRIATRGLSAGGLLQGAVLSRRPDRWRALVAEVPFVDVVNTMLDPSIPLTINEWDEWGDPRVEAHFTAMRAYSPYDNVPIGVRRPAMLVTAAVNDPRVMVHEPAKWVARLRATGSGADGPLLLRVELGAGAHTGPSGRYAHYRYEAEVLAYILDQLEATQIVGQA